MDLWGFEKWKMRFFSCKSIEFTFMINSISGTSPFPFPLPLLEPFCWLLSSDMMWIIFKQINVGSCDDGLRFCLLSRSWNRYLFYSRKKKHLNYSQKLPWWLFKDFYLGEILCNIKSSTDEYQVKEHDNCHTSSLVGCIQLNSSVTNEWNKHWKKKKYIICFFALHYKKGRFVFAKYILL